MINDLSYYDPVFKILSEFMFKVLVVALLIRIGNGIYEQTQYLKGENEINEIDD